MPGEIVKTMSIETGATATLTRASPEDTDKVWSIISTSATWLLADKGLDHWSSYYTRKLVAKKIQNQEVYLLSAGDRPVATISLSSDAVDYYTPDNLNSFADPKATAVYVSSLAVDPNYQGRGIASRLMEFADQAARDRGLKYVRFDCRAEYTDLVDFYKKRGYQEVGSFTEGEGQNYLLMEKVLT